MPPRRPQGVADPLAGVGAEPRAGVARDAPDEVVTGLLERGDGLDEPREVGEREPGGERAATVRPVEERADARAHDAHRVAVGVHGSERLHGRLRHAVEAVRPGRQVVHRLRGRGVEADGVRGARQEHAADALLARGVEHGPRAVDVRREDVLPRPLPADAPEVHHDVRAAHDLAHSGDVAHRRDGRALPVDRIRIHQVEEHELVAGRPQQGPDAPPGHARRSRDHDALRGRHAFSPGSGSGD